MDETSLEHIKALLDQKHDAFNRPAFIQDDPVAIPHRFTVKEDIEISAFLTATIAWGNRTAILKSATALMQRLGEAPHAFVMDASHEEIEALGDFYYRTFQGVDLVNFIYGLRNIYTHLGGLHEVFYQSWKSGEGVPGGLSRLRKSFFTEGAEKRSFKHLASIDKGASCKRLNMFLRWMVRNDKRGVDFGLWKNLPASGLYLPLDVHTGNVARKLGLLQRKANDWKAVEEVTGNLRRMDAADPIKYDFALFGMGIEKWF